MGLFKSKELANVVEWKEYRDDVLFWMWDNDEIKKGSKLIIRPGQDAIFLNSGAIEGIFENDGSYDIDSQIVPFLSTLKGFKYGFDSGMRAQVLFVNTKEVVVKWGTKNAVMIPTPSLPGGMPIRAFGTFCCKIGDYNVMIEKIAGVKKQFTVEDVRERVITVLNPLLMKWIAGEGKDMFNLQASAADISNGIKGDLDMELFKIGITITQFSIESFSYPEEVQKMAEKAAAQSMVGDMSKYQQIAFGDSMTNGGGGAAGAQMGGMMAGMQMGAAMSGMMNAGMAGAGAASGQQAQASPQGAAGGAAPNFCPSCGTPTNGAKFCSNCGQKLV